MRTILILLLACTAAFAEKKVDLKNVPAPVRKTIDELTKSATLVGVSKEVENGATMYEVETKVNGKTRDLMLDAQGRIVSTEEEVAIDSIPAPARAAIEKAAGSGKITLVERVTTGEVIKYEAAIQPKSGKKKEMSFDADGKPVK